MSNRPRGEIFLWDSTEHSGRVLLSNAYSCTMDIRLSPQCSFMFMDISYIYGSEKKLCEQVLSRTGPCVLGVPGELLWHGSEGLADVLFRNNRILARHRGTDVQRDEKDHRRHTRREERLKPFQTLSFHFYGPCIEIDINARLPSSSSIVQGYCEAQTTCRPSWSHPLKAFAME